MIELLAQVEPVKWAELIERIGVPAGFLLFLLVAITYAATWTAKNVVKPVVTSHVKFVEKCGASIETLSKEEVVQTGEIQVIRKQGEQVLGAIEGVGSQVRQVKAIVSRLDRPCSGSGAILEGGPN